MIFLYILVDILSTKAPGLLRKSLWVPVSAYFLVTALKFLLFMAGPRAVRNSDEAKFLEVGKTIPPDSHICTYHTQDLWDLSFQYDLHDQGGIADYTQWAVLARDLSKYQVSYLVITDPSYFAQLPPGIAAHFSLRARGDGLQVYSVLY
jgi:hypothetical protein